MELSSVAAGPSIRQVQFYCLNCSICKLEVSTPVTGSLQGFIEGSNYYCSSCHLSSIFVYVAASKVNFDPEALAALSKILSEAPVENRFCYIFPQMKDFREEFEQKKRARMDTSSPQSSTLPKQARSPNNCHICSNNLLNPTIGKVEGICEGDSVYCFTCHSASLAFFAALSALQFNQEATKELASLLMNVPKNGRFFHIFASIRTIMAKYLTSTGSSSHSISSSSTV